METVECFICEEEVLKSEAKYSEEYDEGKKK